ncbi:MFS transporter, partial [bacterium]|nr:MFS transporter [bacterium]
AMGFGFFNGMYWISYHIFRFDYTKTSNRGNYTGTEKAIGTVIGIILPILGGYIIVQNFYNYGYGNVFLLGSFLYLVSFFIGNIPLPKSTHTKLHLRKTIKEIMKHKDLQKSMIVYFLGGFGRAGALLRILLPLLIFDILQNEFELGGWLSFFALISAFLAVLFGRHINYKHYKNFATIGGLLFFVSILSLIGFPILLTYIIFGIVKELGSLFLQIPKRVISENLVHQIDDYTHHRVEYIVIREWFGILFGRGSSYVLLLFVGSLAVQQLQYVLVIMAFAVIVEILFLRSINQESYK